MLDTYLGKRPRFADHVPASTSFSQNACLSSFRGAIGDCTRAKGHEGPHQDAHQHTFTGPSIAPRI